MATTLQDYFGQNALATFDVSGEVVLQVYLKDFTSEGLATPTDPTTVKGSQLAAALAIKWLNFSVGKDDDATIGVVVNSARVGLTTRGEVNQRETSMNLSIYTPDNTPTIPDPDLIV